MGILKSDYSYLRIMSTRVKSLQSCIIVIEKLATQTRLLLFKKRIKYRHTQTVRVRDCPEARNVIQCLLILFKYYMWIFGTYLEII